MGVTALDLAVFVSGSFVAALASQVAGFAYGLVAAAVWLQLLAPMHTVTLIIALGPVVQGIVGWELRPAPDWRVLWPFLAGATMGVPVGVAILGWTDPTMLHAAIGALLVIFGLGSLMLPVLCRSSQVERSQMPELVFSMAFSAGPSDLQASSSTRGADCAHGRKKFSGPCSNMSDFSFSSSARFAWELEARSMTTPSLCSWSAYRPC